MIRVVAQEKCHVVIPVVFWSVRAT
jgi:hypothetical protein